MEGAGRTIISWRLNGQKLRLKGEMCVRCGTRMFPPGRAKCPGCEAVLIKARKPLGMLKVLTREQMTEKLVIPRKPRKKIEILDVDMSFVNEWYKDRFGYYPPGARTI